jgi:hypothetical protein
LDVSQQEHNVSFRGTGARSNRVTTDYVRQLALDRREELSAPEIHRRVEARYGPRSISLSTVRRVITEIGEDESAPWSAMEADPDEAELVLPVLRAVIQNAIVVGRPLRLSQAEAVAISHIRAVTGEAVPLWDVLQLATAYAHGLIDPADLDAFLAFRPWVGADEAAAYERAVELGRVGRYLGLRYEEPEALYREEMQRREEEARDGEQR